MSSRTSGLLGQIEAGVLDDSVPLATLLQKVIVLGGRAGSEKMRDWARQELNGYVGSDEPIPNYRRIPSALYIWITNRAGYNGMPQRINRSNLPTFITERVDVEEAVLGGGIGELEALVARGDGNNEPHRVSPGWAGALVGFLNENAIQDPISVVVDAYFAVSNASIEGLLVRVRTALAELVAELASLIPEGEEVPSRTAADQATQFVITGKRPKVQITTQHTDSGPNVSAPSAQLATVATGNGTAVGSQTASGENSTVVGTQTARGNNATTTGRDSTTPTPLEQKREGWWARLRKRGVLVAFFTIIGGIAAVLTLLDWAPW